MELFTLLLVLIKFQNLSTLNLAVLYANYIKYFKVADIFKRQKHTPEEQDENMINFIRSKFAYNLSNS